MKLRTSALLLGCAAFLCAGPAAAAGKSGAALLGVLAEGSLSSVVGNSVTAELTNLGVFSALGLGSGPDPVLNAKLDEIINQLQVVQADVNDLQLDVTTLTTTLVQQSHIIQLQQLLLDMEDAQTAIQQCAQQVGFFANRPGTDDTDKQLHDFALQMAVREAGPCDLSKQFGIIHTRIVGDVTADFAQGGVYSLLAQVARGSGTEFERVASHFIQYQITQREALELIRGAYSALGEASELQTVLTDPSTGFLNELKDEEIAFLEAADAYVTAAPPPYDVSPAALADAIVQRLDGVPAQVSSYSLSILDNAQPLTPVVFAGLGFSLMTGSISGASLKYYNTPDTVRRLSNGPCAETPPSDGFSFVRPFNGARGGFKLGSSCTVHVERHLLRSVVTDVPAPSWRVTGRHGGNPVPPFTLLNAATLSPETGADALALGGDPHGHGSGFSLFSVIADVTDPSSVTLSIDLPLHPASTVRVGTAHPFVAGGSGAIATFRRVPYGPPYFDRYALATGSGYLSIDGSGRATTSATPQWFDFHRLPDGHVELGYDGGIVYVDYQYAQIFAGESPDDVWANTVNLASGGAAVSQWAVPNDGIPRVAPTTSLSIYPPCLDSAGNGQFPTSLAGLTRLPSTECSDSSLAYVMYNVVLNNEDDFARTFQFDLGGRVTLPSGVTSGVAGVHCYEPSGGSPNDHFDTNSASVNASTTSLETSIVHMDPTNRNLSVPAHGSKLLTCQVLDAVGHAANLVIDQFNAKSCTAKTGGSCVIQ